jgi:NADPH:quinone reductase-like Zn-dependent oxidoreductase
MKAIVCKEYGPPEVFRLTEVAKPAPADNEVLIKVRAASLNALDWRLMRGKPAIARLLIGGLRKPKITTPGRDVAGQVEAVGRNVTQFKPGDEVFGACLGTCAEYVCANEAKLALKPANSSFEDAAALPVAALTALQGLRDHGRIQSGQKVLVDGAGGGVGTFSVQMAKAFGAEVTAICGTGNQATARAIGADRVMDYTQEDFARSGQRYDLIFAANGYHSIFDYQRALNPRGVLVMAGGGIAQIFQILLVAPILSRMGSKKMGSMMAKVTHEDLVCLKDLMEAGKIISVIDRRYPLSEVAGALGYLEKGHARGKVVITVAHEKDA